MSSLCFKIEYTTALQVQNAMGMVSADLVIYISYALPQLPETREQHDSSFPDLTSQPDFHPIFPLVYHKSCICTLEKISAYQ